ncbi:MAG: N-acetyl-D-Glu racemase DgcA [Gammaproteobacteria bacterium]
MKFSAHIEKWQPHKPFRITGKVWNSFDSVVVELGDEGGVGRGEGMGVYYLEENADGILAQVESVADELMAGLDREKLQSRLPAGGARNAIDCALWDLEAKRSGRSIWELTGVAPKTLETVFTIGIEPEPEDMARGAAAAKNHSLLKVKLDGDRPAERMEAIRAARPDARLVVDANQGWNFRQLQAVAPVMARLGVEMIEQPLPRGGDAELEGYRSPVPLCADESCLTLDELPPAVRRYQMINIKLDKTGGLTHALALAKAARQHGLGLMVGSMCGSSLAMAPTFLIGCLCDLVDVDGPLLQKRDRIPGIRYEGTNVYPFGREIWG